MGKILLCISASEATVAHWSAGKLRGAQRFNATEDGLHAFRAWLALHRGRSTWITVDTPDEEYRLENVPHVAARQRMEILERKLQQLYRGSRFRAGRAVRGVRGKRREDQCLMAAYADERIVLPWMDVLQSAGLLIAGIHPLPLLLVDLLRRTGVTTDPVLLVMRWSGGIRQSVISAGIPLMTRVTSIGDEARLAMLAAEEIRSTREYLGALGTLPSDRALAVFVLDPTLRLVDDHAQPLFRLMRLPAALARSVNAAACDAPPGTCLQLLLLARYRSSINLAPAALREPLRRRNLSRLATAGSLCVGLCCAAVAAAQAIDAMRAARLHTALGTSHRAPTSAPTTAGEAPTTTAPGIDLALRQLDAHEHATHAARRVYVAVSRALDAHPQLTLESLRWEQRALGPDSATGSGEVRLVAVARTTLDSNAADPRDAVLAMRSFAAAIARVSEVEEAQLTAIPPGFDASGTLRGQLSSTRSERSALAFETTVKFKPHHVED